MGHLANVLLANVWQHDTLASGQVGDVDIVVGCWCFFFVYSILWLVALCALVVSCRCLSEHVWLLLFFWLFCEALL